MTDQASGSDGQQTTPNTEFKFGQFRGKHEAEITFGTEADLLKQFIVCQKNPGHTNYIPILDFVKENLPSHYQDDDIYNGVMAEANMTVRVLVEHVSKHRPEIWPDTGEPYPFYNNRGSRCLRVGTGWVRWVEEKFTEEDDVDCPCSECEKSGTPSKTWAKVRIKTAMHLVYDEDEVRHTKCHAFFDDGTEPDPSLCLYGVGEFSCNMDQDWSHFLCVTHNPSLYDKLEVMERRRDEAHITLEEKFNHCRDTQRLVAVVSHPHGCSKYVSLGEWTERHDFAEYNQYTYNTCTCPGSSGSQLFVLGRWRWTAGHPHSGCCADTGLNRSGGGFG